LPASEAAFRLEHFYRPYHAALSDLVTNAQAEFGVAIVVDCHSMPPPAKANDIVLGDCYGEAAATELISYVQKSLIQIGFSVARNTPYAGGYTTSVYGKPAAGVHAFQIEVSRGLYLDEARMEKSAGFASCKERLRRFAARLITQAGPWRRPLRASASLVRKRPGKGPRQCRWCQAMPHRNNILYCNCEIKLKLRFYFVPNC
jgi:N-formylglutamate deformylase